MTPTSSYPGCLIALALVSTLLPGPGAAADDAPSLHYRCQGDGEDDVRLAGVRHSKNVPGRLLTTGLDANSGSWEFDGRAAIAYAAPSNTPGFAENFTWEGFFLTPASNAVLAETGIADRLLTQFAFDKGDWTRLAVGLVAGADGGPRLCVELEGFEGRTFGGGDRPVSTDRWHHFAVVHEGTASAARIRWYLDYALTGELFLGGQANQNTLRPPGSAPLAIGARLKRGTEVNRGFVGLMDEVRLVGRPLQVDEFLRLERSSAEFAPLVDRAGVAEQRQRRQRDEFWAQRHRWARTETARWRPPPGAPSTIDGYWGPPGPLVDDASFLRRLSLTVRGRIPSLDEVQAFLNDQRADKRARVIDQFLASPEWADGWVGYWQDVLAENPSVVFPTLNNSGAFRQWIYESFRDNKPFDRFATELILMESGATGAADGPAGFALATGNDVPMAMRSHVAMKAFAAVDFACARCHDSPLDPYQQADLFLLAAYLKGGPLEVPASSVAAASHHVGQDDPGEDDPGEDDPSSGLITTTLVAGQVIAPQGLRAHWLQTAETADGLRPIQPGPRGELAALLTSPRNRRFSDVIVNRVWQRYFGVALREPVDQWADDPRDAEPPSGERAAAERVALPGELLGGLSAAFVDSGYDLRQLARWILMSRAWQSRRSRAAMTAEQLVDSLFFAVGKKFEGETMGVYATDAGAVQLPRPLRAWQFAALPNERDRPALGMPVNQTIVDVMAAFGWSGNRQHPRTQREQTISPHQPLMLFNGLMSQRIVRLSDRSAITELCLQNGTVSELVVQLFLTVLGRLPDAGEQQQFEAYLRPGYQQRRTGKPPRRFEPLTTFQPDWRKHLEAEQTQLMLAAQRRVARGELPTTRLASDFRERVEDVLWALINSPEFVIVP